MKIKVEIHQHKNSAVLVFDWHFPMKTWLKAITVIVLGKSPPGIHMLPVLSQYEGLVSIVLNRPMLNFYGLQDRDKLALDDLIFSIS